MRRPGLQSRYDHMWLKMKRNDSWCDQGGRCFYCRSRIPVNAVTADHVKPRSKGGTDTGKIKAACQRCNVAKGSMTLSRFRSMLRGEIEPYTILQLHQAIIYRTNVRIEKAVAAVRGCIA